MPTAPETSSRRACQAAVCAAFPGQSLLLAYLLHVDPRMWPAALIAGLVLAAACLGLLARLGDRRNLPLTVLMLATGGLGLLLGLAADFGALGLYGLLELCRSWPVAGTWLAPEQWWAKLNLMPWSWLGMIVGGNAGMALGMRAGRAGGRVAETFILCNAGMLLGMAIADQLATRVTLGFDPTSAAVAMVAAMLGGMALGMNGLLAVARVQISICVPSSITRLAGRLK